jgi:hypothetical protein
MTSNAGGSSRILGSLRSAGGKGVVHMQDRAGTDIDDVWSALTDPSRLARWYGTIEGDLHLGGEYRARLYASGWEGTGWVEACEPPRRLLVTIRHAGDQGEGAIEVTLEADGDQTVVVWEERGMPPDYLARLRGRDPDPRRGSRRPPCRAWARRQQGPVRRASPCLSGPGGQHRIAGLCRLPQ